jgi:hypothetical protein
LATTGAQNVPGDVATQMLALATPTGDVAFLGGHLDTRRHRLGGDHRAARAFFDCGTIDMATGIKAVDYATTAALEEALMCKDRGPQFANLRANVPSIGDFHEAK